MVIKGVLISSITSLICLSNAFISFCTDCIKRMVCCNSNERERFDEPIEFAANCLSSSAFSRPYLPLEV